MVVGRDMTPPTEQPTFCSFRHSMPSSLSFYALFRIRLARPMACGVVGFGALSLFLLYVFVPPSLPPSLPYLVANTIYLSLPSIDLNTQNVLKPQIQLFLTLPPNLPAYKTLACNYMDFRI